MQLFTRAFAPTEIGLLMNHAPMAAPVSDAAILAGRTLLVTNTATDPDLPAQTLRWSLLNSAAGVSLNATNGQLVWRPAINQAGTTNLLTLRVVDNGTPSLSATQAFIVTVTRPASPLLTLAKFDQAAFRMSLSGEVGPDYLIYAATNLSQPDWSLLLATNPVAFPFQFIDSSATNLRQRYYRVLLGP